MELMEKEASVAEAVQMGGPEPCITRASHSANPDKSTPGWGMGE